jgi:hypothetical protein
MAGTGILVRSMLVTPYCRWAIVEFAFERKQFLQGAEKFAYGWRRIRVRRNRAMVVGLQKGETVHFGSVRAENYRRHAGV